MGNRAVVCFSESGEYSESLLGLYVHWNGGRDSIEGFLKATKTLLGDDGWTLQTGWDKFLDVIGAYQTGWTEVDVCTKLDTDNNDNGVYVVGPSLSIVSREFRRYDEQYEYDLDEFTSEVLEKYHAKRSKPSASE